MKKPQSIAIAIPTYNEEKNIKRCLDSLRRQDFKGKTQIIIVDGGSTDKTLQIAQQYSVVVVHNPQKSAEYGKMLAFKRSTSDYFVYLDADIDLVSNQWITKMIRPLIDNANIVGSFTGYVSYDDDPPLSKYITLDFLQRDPLFIYLTPSLSDVCIKKTSDYALCRYSKNRMLPAGLCVYRKRDLLTLEIIRNRKFMELDIVASFVKEGKTDFAYVTNAGLHHPLLSTLKNLAWKRKRNLETMYFNQPDKRYWTWIEWNNPYHIAKIILWVFLTFTILPSTVIGIWKSIRHKTFVGLYELPFNLITTHTIIITFITHFVRRYRKVRY